MGGQSVGMSSCSSGGSTEAAITDERELMPTEVTPRRDTILGPER
jgi:hypothetical protein